ncbi:hypothetical protein AB6A40_002549 [Gnathostoma spinigerum]|uniref:Uncharacterized protein n=1 Tax=Gnathostoma spinigerum TaxID=75299 RepID=A0ABD6EHP6_9BILA
MFYKNELHCLFDDDLYNIYFPDLLRITIQNARTPGRTVYIHLGSLPEEVARKSEQRRVQEGKSVRAEMQTEPHCTSSSLPKTIPLLLSCLPERIHGRVKVDSSWETDASHNHDYPYLSLTTV